MLNLVNLANSWTIPNKMDILRRIWSLPKWRSYVNTKNPVINKGTYVCEILALFLNTVMDDLSINYDTWSE